MCCSIFFFFEQMPSPSSQLGCLSSGCGWVLYSFPCKVFPDLQTEHLWQAWEGIRYMVCVSGELGGLGAGHWHYQSHSCCSCGLPESCPAPEPGLV